MGDLRRSGKTQSDLTKTDIIYVMGQDGILQPRLAELHFPTKIVPFTRWERFVNWTLRKFGYEWIW